ncbi:hypothetical protein J6590_056847 [Homalodisca vitripennis]|nr:hypothetical protein J6590_056847 [Homalodisca vitripennis]
MGHWPAEDLIKPNSMALRAYVRPLLEYSSAVWAPHQDYLRQEIQRVQRKFIRIVGFRMGFNYDEMPVSDLERALNLNSLEERRYVQDAMFHSSWLAMSRAYEIHGVVRQEISQFLPGGQLHDLAGSTSE